MRHEVERTGELIGLPGGATGPVEGPGKVELAGQGLVRSPVRQQERHIVVQLGLDLVDVPYIPRGDVAVLFNFGA